MLRSIKSRGGITQVHWTGGDADLTAAPLLPKIEFGSHSAMEIIFLIMSVHGDGAFINRKHFAPRNGTILPAI